MRENKRFFVLIIFLLGGIVLGGLLGALGQRFDFLSWLSYGQSFGFAADSPAVLELGVLSLTFGVSVRLNVAAILCVLAALIAYKRFA